MLDPWISCRLNPPAQTVARPVARFDSGCSHDDTRRFGGGEVHLIARRRAVGEDIDGAEARDVIEEPVADQPHRRQGPQETIIAARIEQLRGVLAGKAVRAGGAEAERP